MKKVFLSWSGNTSKKIALALRTWLKFVLPGIEPWMSKVDMESGKLWPLELANELSNIDFGILCLTAENLREPWIYYEAGALIKHFEHSTVIPLLYGLEPDDLRGPLQHLQAKTLNRDELMEVVASLNEFQSSPWTESQLKVTFDKWWPDLDKRLHDELNYVTENIAYEFSRERFGVGHEEVVFESEIDAEGQAKVSRYVIISAYSRIETLDTDLFYPEDDDNPDKKLEFKSVKALSRKPGLKIEAKEQERPRGKAYDLFFKPPIEPGEIADYRLEEFARGPHFGLGQPGLDAETEFWGWNTDRPTKKLTLRVVFPDGQTAENPRTVVMRASCSSGRKPRMENEERRVGRPIFADPRADGKVELVLDVESPVHGLRYLMYWDPKAIT